MFPRITILPVGDFTRAFCSAVMNKLENALLNLRCFFPKSRVPSLAGLLFSRGSAHIT